VPCPKVERAARLTCGGARREAEVIGVDPGDGALNPGREVARARTGWKSVDRLLSSRQEELPQKRQPFGTDQRAGLPGRSDHRRHHQQSPNPVFRWEKG